MTKRAIADVSTADGRKRATADSSPLLVPALTIVAHPSGARAGERLALDALLVGEAVAVSRNIPDFVAPGHALGLPLGDPFVSRKPIRFAPAPDGRVRLVAGQGGPLTVDGAKLRGDVELGPDDLASGVPLELAERVLLLLHMASREAAPVARDALAALGMKGNSVGIQRVRSNLGQIVDLDVPVLIRGETGTGKELVARALHTQGPRRAGPFMSVNLGALPRELAAAELFGAHKGAYTGATRDREGLFAAARGGTLFLDEVGEAAPEVQVMLLRVIETGEMHPVGAPAPVATDVRLVAATDANLEAQIREGRFKAPLLHRLAGYEIRLPALRERREDIGLLFCHFARQELAATGEAHRLTPDDPYCDPWLPTDLAMRLLAYDWPGNIRQLRNLTRQVVISSRGRPQLQLDPRLEAELGSAPDRGAAALAASTTTTKAPRRSAGTVTKAELEEALRASGWDLKPAADRLGIPRSSIYDLIDRYPGVRRASDLSVEEITGCFHACGGDMQKMVERLHVSGQALKRRLKELGLQR